jgi:hypothetical protein
VRLAPFEEDNIPEQFGHIVEDEEEPWAPSGDCDPSQELVMVRLDVKYRTCRHDDGLREVPLDQVTIIS